MAFTFTFLNLTFIFPLLAALKVPFVLALNPLLQSLLISLTVLVTGYLLLSLNNFVLKFLTGELWNTSLLGSLLIRRQKSASFRGTKGYAGHTVPQTASIKAHPTAPLLPRPYGTFPRMDGEPGKCSQHHRITISSLLLLLFSAFLAILRISLNSRNPLLRVSAVFLTYE